MTKHYVVTLTTGTPVDISTVIASPHGAKRRATIWMQPRSTNTAPIYIGTASNITATDYGVRLPAPVASEPPPPFNPGEFAGSPEKFRSPLRASDFYALGTTGDFLHLLVVDY